jgi:hypothetical protein
MQPPDFNGWMMRTDRVLLVRTGGGAAECAGCAGKSESGLAAASSTPRWRGTYCRYC